MQSGFERGNLPLQMFRFEKHACRAFRLKSFKNAKPSGKSNLSRIFLAIGRKYAYKKTKVILAYARKLLQTRAFCGIIAL